MDYTGGNDMQKGVRRMEYDYSGHVGERWWRNGNETLDTLPKEELLRLIAEELTGAMVYLELSRQYTGREAAMLRRLYEEKHAHFTCLKGVYTLITGEHPVVRAAPKETGNLNNTLRWCYGQEMRCLVSYETHRENREYGPVFEKLAAQEQEHCKMLLEIIGSKKK